MLVVLQNIPVILNAFTGVIKLTTQINVLSQDKTIPVVKFRHDGHHRPSQKQSKTSTGVLSLLMPFKF